MDDHEVSHMFAPANHAQFRLSLPGVEHDFQVLAFSGFEAISQPYAFELELVSERPDHDLHRLLHQPAFLTLSSAGNGIHGVVEQIAQGESGQRLTRYQMTLVPHLSRLAHRRNARIFQQQTVPQIIAQLLEEHGIQADAYRFQLGPTVYPERDYCVQYAESDLHFLQRLCEEEGIHYHFQHSAHGHVLVFGDDQTAFPRLGQPTAYLPGSGQIADEPAIQRFSVRVATRTQAVSRRDYDFEKPRLVLHSAATHQANTPLEDYDFPGRFVDRERGKHLSQRTLELHHSDARQAQGQSDQARLISGHFLEISEHPRAEWNDLWLLTELHHEGKQPQVLEDFASGDTASANGFTQGYRNRFTATPWDVPYRPALRHPKPRLQGSQSAVVTGPAGEDIHCDDYGRIKVHFFWDREHWDRDGQADGKTSCWLRVASNWAGNRYGGIAIPRVGMEVLVSFLEGDPDQPLVTGCLYHKEHPVPYELPANKTRTLFKTLSSPGGDGFNELRIEDRKDAEQIYIHAQRDWEQHIQHDQTVHVGHERHDRVIANSHTELKAEEHRLTHGARKTELKADDHLSVGQNQHIKLGAAHLLDAGQEIHLKAGQKLIIEAGNELTLKAGGSFIKLDPGGVTLVGPQVKINAGGSAGKGSGVKIVLPTIIQRAMPVTESLAESLAETGHGKTNTSTHASTIMQGKVTFEAEGNNTPTSRYYSRVIHWPGNKLSGVTLGRGYDMGSRSESEIYNDMTMAGLEQDQAEKISKAAGLKGSAAEKFVQEQKNDIGEITENQQITLFINSYPTYVSRSIDNYNKWTQGEAERIEWQHLDQPIKDILVDFVYQGFTKGPNPMKAGMRNNISMLIHYIENTPGINQYEPGRHRALYLKNSQASTQK
jgi:type VI secretion system secreted protein VgrG